MINFDDAKKEIIKENISNRPQIPDNSYRVFLLGAQDLEKQIHY